MQTSLVMVVFSLAVAVSTVAASPAPIPNICDIQAEEPSDGDCYYGQTFDRCGNKVCMKGPGEMCGGKFGRYGICGDGLMCSNCNRCQGCSYRTFVCWNDNNCMY